MKQIPIICLLLISLNTFPQYSFYQININEGYELLKQKDINGAIVKFSEALNGDSLKVEAYYGLGVAYQYYCQTIGNYCNESLFFLDKAISIDDKYRKCYYNRGCWRVVLQDYKEAIKDFNLAIVKQPNNPQYYLSRGTSYLKLDMRDKGCADIKKAADLNSSAAKILLESQNCK